MLKLSLAWRMSTLVVLLMLLAGCSSTSLSSAGVGSTQTGIASFYADKYQSRQTANGERFDQQASTAAHKSLPFNTRVRVTNVENGKSTIVRINDRGPFVAGRIIDLSRSAFDQIADANNGLVRVEIEVIE